MGSLINPTPLTFNGGVSTAAQYSVSFGGFFQKDTAAFMLRASYTAGKLGVTLQMNADPLGAPVFDWQDFATTSVKVLTMATSTELGQTDGSIALGALRSGIIVAASSGSGVYLLRFSPLPSAIYRLKFEPESATRMTVDYVMTLP